MSETIVAAYDTPEHADLVIQDLLQAQVPQDHIHRHTRDGDDLTAEMALMVYKHGSGFWTNLFGFDVGDDHLAYDYTLEGGGTVVRVTFIPDQDYDAVLAILERHHPVDLDARGAKHGLQSGGAEADAAAANGPVGRGGPRVRHYNPRTDSGR